jgi:hypothetical protein
MATGSELLLTEQQHSDLSSIAQSRSLPAGYVSSSNIIIEDMPHNCDFLKAPIGDKGCHFEKDVAVTKDDAGRNSRVYVTWDRKED